MINKKSIWFLTLFSLILVLSVYYVTMPSELLLTNKNNYMIDTNSDNNETEVTSKEEEANVEVKESSVLVALRVEAEEKMLEEIETLNKVKNQILFLFIISYSS